MSDEMHYNDDVHHQDVPDKVEEEHQHHHNRHEDDREEPHEVNQEVDEKGDDETADEDHEKAEIDTLEKSKSEEVDEEAERNALLKETEEQMDEKTAADMELIQNSQPSTALEHALFDALQRKEQHVVRLSNEIQKLKAFISKRKQTYKRKRKEEGAPTRALSAYNIFIQDRFAQLAKENEKALKSTDSDAQLKRVPPANLVASTGNQWKELPAEEKAKYEERAKTDRKRYEEQMSQYQPPDRASNRKRNKTGCKLFALSDNYNNWYHQSV
jgi:hypothetical protein